MDLKEQILAVTSDYMTTRSIKQTAQNMKLATGTVRKMLITANVWGNKASRRIAELRREHPQWSNLQIAQAMNVSVKSVQLYSPYEGLEELGNPQDKTIPESDKTVDRGSCGDYVSWVFKESGTLIISGKGTTWDYASFVSFGLNSGSRPGWVGRRDGYFVKNIYVEEGITSIGQYMFSKLYNLESVSLPKTITKIEGGAFEGENYLKTIVIPERVDRIAWDTFWNCTYLEKIHIPASVSKIQTFAFHGCVSLKKMYFYGDAPQITDTTFDRLPVGGITVYHKEGAKGFEDGMWNGYRTEVF